MWLFELSLESKISKTLRTICLMNRNPILIFVTILRKNHPPGPSSIVHPRKLHFCGWRRRWGRRKRRKLHFGAKLPIFCMRKTFVILLAVAVVCGGLVHEKGRFGARGVVWCTYRLWTSYLSMPISRRSRMKSEVTATWNFLE